MEEQIPNSEFTGAIDSSEFLDETTPMDVAAVYGRFDMIKMLAMRGHFIKKPHPPSCYCDDICKFVDKLFRTISYLKSSYTRTFQTREGK